MTRIGRYEKKIRDGVRKAYGGDYLKVIAPEMSKMAESGLSIDVLLVVIYDEYLRGCDYDLKGIMNDTRIAIAALYEMRMSEKRGKRRKFWESIQYMYESRTGSLIGMMAVAAVICARTTDWITMAATSVMVAMGYVWNAQIAEGKMEITQLTDAKKKEKGVS